MRDDLDGFLELSLAELERLERLCSEGRLQTPVQSTQLLAERVPNAAKYQPLLGQFTSQEGLLTFLSAVRRQRAARLEVPRPEIVWSGREPRNSRARETQVVLRRLFEKAEREVFMAGYAFDGGDDLLEPLWEAMRDRGVKAEIVLNCSREKVYEETEPDAILARTVRRFLDTVWEFGDPTPDLFYDPRTLIREPPRWGAEWFPPHSMHAKCIVVDRREVLVGSANFTSRAQERNIEVGVALNDRHFAEGLLHQWTAAKSAGLVLPAPDLAD